MSGSGIIQFESYGRTGVLRYIEGGRAVEVDWEISGVGEYDILLANRGLRYWKGEDVAIPIEKRLGILKVFREWMQSNNMRSDWCLPEKFEVAEDGCMRVGCEERRLEDYAYCRRHYDLILIGEEEE